MKPLLFTCKYGGTVEVAGAGETVMNDDATRWLKALTAADCTAASRWARAHRRDDVAVE